jgi:hypothetical protein
MSDTKLTESEIAAMQTEEIKALKAQLAKKDKKLAKKDKELENVVAQHYIEKYVLYCIQRQRIMKRALAGCGQCTIWNSTHLQDYGC